MRQLSLLTPAELEALIGAVRSRRRSPLEDAARRYAAAVVNHAEAGPTRAGFELLLEREQAEHELISLAGFRCPYCSDGDCPLRRISDTRPLDEWQDERDQDREDRRDADERWGRAREIEL